MTQTDTRTDRPYDAVKRSLDLTGSAVALILLLPLLLIVGLFVRLMLGSPVMFRQQRPGLNGAIFNIWKFRTMRDVNASQGIVDDADRLTRFGVALRSASLDELPALVNVLRGDMSFVGPRPLLAQYLPLYSKEQSRRHDVRPGITGLSQVNGRNSLAWATRLALDVEYVQSRSLFLDLRILARTVAVVLARRGVAADGHATMPEFLGSSEARDETR
jgi:lipopolysaccharide/colanic/teichoic acid biosynthesis glycosyltransferase